MFLPSYFLEVKVVETYRQLDNAGDFISHVIQLAKRPEEVGAKLEKHSGDRVWVHLYPTKNGRWRGSSRWVSVVVPFRDLDVFLSSRLPSLGIKLEQLDFREGRAVLDYTDSLGFDVTSYRDENHDDYYLYKVLVDYFLYRCNSKRR